METARQYLTSKDSQTNKPLRSVFAPYSRKESIFLGPVLVGAWAFGILLQLLLPLFQICKKKNDPEVRADDGGIGANLDEPQPVPMSAKDRRSAKWLWGSRCLVLILICAQAAVSPFLHSLFGSSQMFVLFYELP